MPRSIGKRPTLSLKEVSSYWGVAETWVRSLVVTAKLPASKVSGKYLVREDDLERYENAHPEDILKAARRLLQSEFPAIPRQMQKYNVFHSALDRFVWLLKAYYTPRESLSRRRQIRIDELLQYYIREVVGSKRRVAAALGMTSEQPMSKQQSEALEAVWYNELAYGLPRVPDPYHLTHAAVALNLERSYERLMFPSWRIVKAYYVVYHAIRALSDICGARYRREEHGSPHRVLKANRLAPLTTVLVGFPFSLGYGARTKWKRHASYLPAEKPHLEYKYANHPRPPHLTFGQTLSATIEDLRARWKTWPSARAANQLYMLPDLLSDFRVWANYVDVRSMLSLYGEGFRGYLDMNLSTICFFYAALVELAALAAFGAEAVVGCLQNFESVFICRSDSIWEVGSQLPTTMRFTIYDHVGRLEGAKWAFPEMVTPGISLLP